MESAGDIAEKINKMELDIKSKTESLNLILRSLFVSQGSKPEVDSQLIKIVSDYWLDCQECLQLDEFKKVFSRSSIQPIESAMSDKVRKIRDLIDISRSEVDNVMMWTPGERILVYLRIQAMLKKAITEINDLAKSTTKGLLKALVNLLNRNTSQVENSEI